MTGRSIARNLRDASTSLGTLDRVLNVLEIVVRGGADTTLAKIATQAVVPKPTAHRILMGLARREYVRSWGHGHYGPGPQTFVLAGMANAVRDYAVIGQLALKGLRTHTNDTIHLALLAGDEAVYIEKLEGNRAYESVSKVGLHLQLHCTAIGKAILAALPDAACDELLQRLPLPRRTPHTLTDLPTLRRELALTRARQFAFDDEENEESVRCVGAAFRDQHDAVVGAVSVSAPVFTMSMEDAIAVAPAVLAAAGAVSIALGASPGHTAAFRQRQTPGTSSHCPCPSGSVPPASARRSDDAAVDLPTTHQSGHVNAVDRRTTQQAWSHD